MKLNMSRSPVKVKRVNITCPVQVQAGNLLRMGVSVTSVIGLKSFGIRKTHHPVLEWTTISFSIFTLMIWLISFTDLMFKVSRLCREARAVFKTSRQGGCLVAPVIHASELKALHPCRRHPAQDGQADDHNISSRAAGQCRDV